MNKIYFSKIRPVEKISFEEVMICQSPANAQLLARYFNTLKWEMN